LKLQFISNELKRYYKYSTNIYVTDDHMFRFPFLQSRPPVFFHVLSPDF